MSRDDEVFAAAVEAVAVTIDALAILALPDLDTLTDAQTRGKTCVWDAVALTTSTAVDLGERMSPRRGTEVRWFPRVCRSCIATLAHHTLYGHAPLCERCVDDAGSCDTGMALRRVAREFR